MEEDRDPLLASFKAQHVNLLGPMILGLVLDSILLGVFAGQLLRYCQASRKDSMIVRWLVFGLAIFEVVDTSIATTNVYIIFVRGFGDYMLAMNATYIDVTWYLTAATSALSQLFFLHRCRNLYHRSMLITISGLLLIVSGLVVGFFGATYLAVMHPHYGLSNVFLPFLLTWKSLGVITDLALTSLIVTSLVRARTGWKKSDANINSLLRVVCETQLLPLLAAVGWILLFAFDRSSDWFLMTSYAEVKLYGLSVLHALNCRDRLRSDFARVHPLTDIESSRRTEKGVYSEKEIGVHEEVYAGSAAPGQDDEEEPMPRPIIQVITAGFPKASLSSAKRGTPEVPTYHDFFPSARSKTRRWDAETISLESFERRERERKQSSQWRMSSSHATTEHYEYEEDVVDSDVNSISVLDLDAVGVGPRSGSRRSSWSAQPQHP